MRYAALTLALLTLASCRYFENDAQFGYSLTGPTTASAFTTADIRVITERENPVTHQRVVCTEPSPDVAKAISTAIALSAQGGGGQASGGIAASGATAEAVAELAGRSTALLGLRDGLFQACQAYANGVIGADIYALIVSRYGQLLTTLFLGQDIAAIPQPVAVAASPGISTTTTAAPGNTNGGLNASITVQPGAPPVAAQADTAVAVTGQAAAAIARMNEDYLNLDYNPVHDLSVVCVNRNDPTTLHLRDARGVPMPDYWLNTICGELKRALTPEGLAQMAKLPPYLVKGGVLGKPVDPLAAANPGAAKPPAAPAGSGGKAKTKAPSCTGVTTAVKAQILQVLQSEKYLTDSDNYTPALNKFETDYGTGEAACATNQVGQKTLTVIQALAAAEKAADKPATGHPATGKPAADRPGATENSPAAAPPGVANPAAVAQPSGAVE
ncbi:MAG TPA: hypothetical protein VG651_22080 [Stellaceae bacterium]|nr:hypothetical protein [Stellaceae bacterium]